MISVKRYEPSDSERWNAFVSASKQGTFLLNRGYMDYHGDRFSDHSLMFYDERGSLCALLPANERDDTLWSHQGLTYGSLVTSASVTTTVVVDVFKALNEHLRRQGIHRVVYKAIPYIYHQLPAEEDLFALFHTCHASLMARDIASAIIGGRHVKWRHDRRYGAKHGKANGIVVERSDNYEAFWRVLDGNLTSTYGVHPVHTLDEMILLKSRFPQNIQLYTASRGDEMLGGTVLYITPQVVHAQYISASAEGKRLRAIDALFDVVLNHDYADAAYFDFGKSTEDMGHVLNSSLIYQKEGFGGRGVCYDWYTYNV